MKTLHGYQHEAIKRLRQTLSDGTKRAILQLPTGAGKTVIASEIIRLGYDKGRRWIFTCPAIELIDQTVEKFRAHGIHDIGVIQADHPLTDPSKQIQVASVQTLARRKIPAADGVIIDEAHRMYRSVIDWMGDEKWASVPFIGLTATPWATGMGRIWDRLIIGSTTSEMIEQGYLSKFRVFAPSHPDLDGVKTIGGDFHEGQLAEAMQRGSLVADVVTTWIAKAERRPTLVFAVDRGHARALCDQFQSSGVKAGYVDGDTPKMEREQIRKNFERGEYDVVCNVGVLTTGVDWDVRCIVLARPTKSEMLYVQMIGRGLRTAPGKLDCIAEGSPVLTDQGLVPIEHVTRAMRVWDGENWVEHGGAICKGEQNTIGYDGVIATPDHKVWTQYGWKSLRSAADGQLRIAKTGRDGEAVRLGPHCFARGELESNPQRIENSVRSGPVRLLRASVVDQLLEHCSGAIGRMPRLQPAFAGAQMACSSAGSGEGSLHEPEQRSVHGLWRTGYRVSLPHRDRCGNLGERESWDKSRSGNRPHRQRSALRSGESEAFNPETKPGPYTAAPDCSDDACLSLEVSGNTICGRDPSDTDRKGDDGGRDFGEVGKTLIQTKRRVWDILDAGPLHRFTVSGRLVHNCVILDHSDTTLRLGFVTDIHHERLSQGKIEDAQVQTLEPPKPRECRGCTAVMPKRATKCPECGMAVVIGAGHRNHDVEIAPGELVELEGRRKKKDNRNSTKMEKSEFYANLKAFQIERGYNPNWSANKYRDRFGVWPNDPDIRYVRPSATIDSSVRSWIKSQQIRWSKSKARNEGRR